MIRTEMLRTACHSTAIGQEPLLALIQSGSWYCIRERAQRHINKCFRPRYDPLRYE